MPRLLSLGTAMAVASVSLALLVPLSASNAATSSASPTAYLMSGAGWGTNVTGGSLPVDSGKTGFVTLGCADTPGQTQSAETAGVDLGGLVTVGAIGGTVSTSGSGGTLGVTTTHHIASISIGDPSVGSLNIGAITSSAYAYHDSKGFHTSNTFDLATISASLVGQTFSLPLNALTDLLKGQSLTIPGLATISLGTNNNKTTGSMARAITQGLKITVIPTKTTILVGNSQARIRKATQPALFHGSAQLIGQSSLLGNLVELGNNVSQNMPCDGRKAKTTSVAELPLAAGSTTILDVGAGKVSNAAHYDPKTATAVHDEKAQLADINIAGQLDIHAITAQAHVEFTKNGKLVINSDGTTLGGITVAGKTYDAPSLNGFSIPGILSIASPVVTKTNSGITVTALEVKLLNGTGATIDLGKVHATISKARMLRLWRRLHHKKVNWK